MERGRGLALLFFLIILLFFVAPSPRFLVNGREKDAPFATLAMNDSKEVFIRPCTKAEECHSLKGREQEELSLFLFGKMNVNTASFEKLTTIRGVGPKMAKEICLLRQKRAFTCKQDLRLLKGVGVKKAQYLEKFFLFENITTIKRAE